ncbi:hypothetical protein [Frondihabitans australicus]|uniref:Uncharacterized protein n=1 Tax=Frondihabitans australicus TaxID=386892 RepID=A0A495IM24_9MICO|nr:hypothetical protein [Frondihabitans australicus]RKR76311.1 hypothetical protein C8E83_3480 [Frondihabitans australicus]
MDASQAQIRITVFGGLVARADWLAVVAVPAGVSVDIVDFGYRVTVIVTREAEVATVVADLVTGDAALSTVETADSPVVMLARRILAARMAMGVADPGPPAGEPATELRALIEATGAVWISTDPDDEDSGMSEEG